MRKHVPVWVVIVIAALALLYIASKQADQQYNAARQVFIETAQASARSDLQKLNLSMLSIYENLRTLASLPGVRTIDRHATNLSNEARETFRQINYNIATSIAASEIYILPIDFAPEQIDPATGKPQEPIIMFDQLIVNAGVNLSLGERHKTSVDLASTEVSGPPEVEIYEYRQLVEQASWFKQRYPTLANTSEFNVPLISGPELITCDNTNFVHTGKDADRSGVILSVPFYGSDGNIKGLVSLIVLSSALGDLLPAPHYALVNSGYNYANLGTGAQAMATSLSWIQQSSPDPSLIYSEVIPLTQVDSRSPWKVWSGLSNEEFFTSSAAISADQTRQFNYVAIIFIALAVGSFVSLILRHLDQSRTLNDVLVVARDKAQEDSELFKDLNNQVTVLNMGLENSIQELKAAQEEIVSKGKMAQLGQLTATVAHELRNPLSVVRNASFVVMRKASTAGLDLNENMARIDSGISRCDNIISQLLDFSRVAAANLSMTEVDNWLAAVIAEEAAKLPSAIEIKCTLGLGDLKVAFDADRMRRVITNILSNASEAMIGKDGMRAVTQTLSSTIQVATRLQPRGVEIIITDNGPGMTDEVLTKSREPLFTTKSFGTGLGLPVVEQVLKLHGGGLDIWSKAGQGARFTAWFPLVHEESKAA
jgi:signal transduction histidine kinase